MAPLGSGPDRSPRVVRLRPVGVALIVLACFAGLIGLVTKSSVLGMLTVAVGAVVVWDVLSARAALTRVQLRITNPVTAVVGEAVPHVVEARGMDQPLVLVRPGSWGGPSQLTIALHAAGPGTILLDAPHRGVWTHEVFDVVAPGPLGLAEAAFRERLHLPVPLHVAPLPRPHEIDWPALRTIPLGESATVTRGDDLFRGVRHYARGDSRRSVHWPATAHHRTLMVKEHDGLEQVALRVVVDLPYPSPASEAAIARAAWIVEQSVARGWLVHLVTAVAPPLPPAPVGRPWSFAPPPVALAPATETVEARITRDGEAHRQLAAAGIGRPTIEKWTGLTCVVSPDGDRWT